MMAYSNRDALDRGLTAICFLIALMLVALWITVGLWSLFLNKDCLGYLKRAADSNTVERAHTEMDRALKYLDEHKIRSGYTSVVYNTPNEDIGFWYKNLVDAKMELAKVKENKQATELEKSNVLMKLRETLLDHGGSGERLTVPMGLSRYPQNGPVAFGQVLLVILFMMTGGWKILAAIGK